MKVFAYYNSLGFYLLGLSIWLGSGISFGVDAFPWNDVRSVQMRAEETGANIARALEESRGLQQQPQQQTQQQTQQQAQDLAFLDDLDVCGGFNLIAHKIPGGRESCICRNNIVQCSFDGECNQDGSVCTDIVGLSIQYVIRNSKVARLNVRSCFSYTTPALESMCTDVMIADGAILTRCKSATYGGQECLCNVCADQKSLKVDCSALNAAARSDGCHRLSDVIPALALFDERL